MAIATIRRLAAPTHAPMAPGRTRPTPRPWAGPFRRLEACEACFQEDPSRTRRVIEPADEGGIFQRRRAEKALINAPVDWDSLRRNYPKQWPEPVHS